MKSRLPAELRTKGRRAVPDHAGREAPPREDRAWSSTRARVNRRRLGPCGPARRPVQKAELQRLPETCRRPVGGGATGPTATVTGLRTPLDRARPCPRSPNGSESDRNAVGRRLTVRRRFTSDEAGTRWTGARPLWKSGGDDGAADEGSRGPRQARAVALTPGTTATDCFSVPARLPVLASPFRH